MAGTELLKALSSMFVFLFHVTPLLALTQISAVEAFLVATTTPIPSQAMLFELPSVKIRKVQTLPSGLVAKSVDEFDDVQATNKPPQGDYTISTPGGCRVKAIKIKQL